MTRGENCKCVWITCFFAKWKGGLKLHNKAKLKIRTFCHLQTQNKAIENQKATFNCHIKRLCHDSQGKASIQVNCFITTESASSITPMWSRFALFFATPSLHQFDPIRSSQTEKISKIKWNGNNEIIVITNCLFTVGSVNIFLIKRETHVSFLRNKQFHASL